MKFQPKCILSDCDGVIVDSEAVAEGIIIEVLGGIFGCEIVAKEIEGSFGIRIAEILSNLERKHRRVFDACSRISILREIDYRISLASPPIQGVRSAYEALQLPVAIVSNSSPERIRVSVGRAGLDDLVGRHIYSGDEVKTPSRRLMFT